MARPNRQTQRRTEILDAAIGLIERHDLATLRVTDVAAELGLTANAVRFTSAGGEIVLRLRTSGGRAIMEVADTGAGIAPELLPTVMDRFVRGDASRERISL